MAESTQWKITELEFAHSIDNRANVVCAVTWSCNVREIVDLENYDAVAIGKTSIEYDDQSNFVDYDALTEDVVWGWIGDKVDKQQIERLLRDELTRKKNPPTATSEPPWVSSSD
jgi:hypothetical protein